MVGTLVATCRITSFCFRVLFGDGLGEGRQVGVGVATVDRNDWGSRSMTARV